MLTNLTEVIILHCVSDRHIVQKYINYISTKLEERNISSKEKKVTYYMKLFMLYVYVRMNIHDREYECL